MKIHSIYKRIVTLFHIISSAKFNWVCPDRLFILLMLQLNRRLNRGNYGEDNVMNTCLLLCCCGLLVTASVAFGLSEYRLGGSDGNAWQSALSLEGAGEYLVVDNNSQLQETVAVGTTPHGAGTDTLIDFSGTSIRPRFVEQDVNLSVLESANTSILPYIGGKVHTTLDCANDDSDILTVRKMFDGDQTTAMFRPFTSHPDAPSGYCAGYCEGVGWGVRHAAVVDFRAAVPVNRIRFYPRLSPSEDALLIEELAEPRPSQEAYGVDSFSSNFITGYEIRSADNTVKYRNNPCDDVGRLSGLPWVTRLDPRLQVFKSAPENLDVVVDLHFPTQSIRWLTFQAFGGSTFEVAEMEVYGEGFAEETVFITQILDFGKAVNWGKIRWTGEQPPGTRVEIQTRSGKTPDPNLYFVESENLDIVPVPLDEYEDVNILDRQPVVFDEENWSVWSPPYGFAAGLRNDSLPAEGWLDGTTMVSPGPSRYLQILIRFYSTFTTAPRLDQLTLQFGGSPSAQELFGEIWPIQVETIEPTTFTYVVRPKFQEGNIGFDRLEVLTHTRVDRIHSVRLGGEEVDRDLYPVVVEDDRFVVAFPHLIGRDNNLVQLEVVFDAPVLRYGTEFRGWVFNSEEAQPIKQQVKPGDATFRFSGNILSVRTPLGSDLLADVQLVPGIFSPNGDGVNETLTISYKLRELTAERPISLRIYNLGGKLLYESPSLLVKSGEFAHQWGGRDGNGRLVPPGIYLYELSIQAETEETKRGTFAVAY